MSREPALNARGGVTSAKGFRAAGISAGIKTSGDPDLALVVNDGPLSFAAGVFTRNQVKAAPVLWTQAAVTDGRLRAVVLNSGGANACTGAAGLADARAAAEAAAAALSQSGGRIDPSEIGLCSTGLIGDRLPMNRVLAGIQEISRMGAGDAAGGDAAARAIMTTDSVPKQSAMRHADGWTVGSMAKGAGMLAPSLATMLCVITTDVVADAAGLNTALRRATAQTFDLLDVDGSCSTNDTVLFLCSGASELTPPQHDLEQAVLQVCEDLCRQLQADAEGVTKRVVISVSGARSEAEAVAAARAIARDSLVKTALFGSDPNWGRVMAALGTAPVPIDQNRISVSFNGFPVCVGGCGDPDARGVDLSALDVNVDVDLGAGDASASIRTTDLSIRYITSNSSYSS